MKTKTILRAVAVVAIMAAIIASTGCKAQKGPGGCGRMMEDPQKNQDINKLGATEDIFLAFDIHNNPFS